MQDLTRFVRICRTRLRRVAIAVNTPKANPKRVHCADCAAAPVINTGIFVIGMFTCFFGTMSSLPSLYPDAFGQFGDALQVVFIGLAGVNFIGELIVNLVLSPAVVRIVDIVQKKLGK